MRSEPLGATEVESHMRMRKEERQNTENSFFKGKRPWSRIKDKVLADYMAPYLAKVSKLGRPILLIDCFAGPGRFERDQEKGSPLIMCELAERYAKGQCHAIFVNKRPKRHKQLVEALDGFIRMGIVVPILGDAQSLLAMVKNLLGDHTVFIYLDPFGLKGCDFETIKAILQRGPRFSTEALINLSMPTLHRLAARHAMHRSDPATNWVTALHAILDRTLGGDYWREYMFDDTLEPAEKERSVIGEYVSRLKRLLPYAGSCPVREEEGTRVKYFITFCSRHPDAIILMNDIMCDAYNQHIYEASIAKFPLLAPGIPHWRASRDASKEILYSLVLDEVARKPGRSRKEVWVSLVTERFMMFRGAEFREAVQELHDSRRLASPTKRRTQRLNDQCLLYITK